jgi:hypothetical protein
VHGSDQRVIAMETTAPEREAVAPRPRRAALPQRARHALLTTHIVVSVALLGDSAGYLAVAIRTSTLDDPALVHDSVKTLNMFSLVFGIPLSFAALLTGIALGLGTRWGVFRYPWVAAFPTTAQSHSSRRFIGPMVRRDRPPPGRHPDP